MAQEGSEITNSSIIEAFENMLKAVPKKREGMVVYMGCSYQGMIDINNYCQNEDCSNCTKYRKALKEYGRG